MDSIEILKKRRSQYQISSDIKVSKAELVEAIQKAIELAPSAFNSQTSRAVILFGKDHKQFWEFVKEAIAKVAQDQTAIDNANKKIDGAFAAGFGTVLFFEDQATVKAMQENVPAYAENFPTWSQQGSGMAQLAVWSTLADLEIGATLQHYNPIVDEATKKEWQIPESWKLTAQMPFGNIVAPAADKESMSRSDRFKVFGA